MAGTGEGVPRWVKVAGNANPTNFLRGRGIVSVGRVGVGQFDVTFDTNITLCAWFATRNDNSAGAAGPGQIAVEQATNVDPTKLRVRTFDSAGAAADPASDDGFSLMVLC